MYLIYTKNKKIEEKPKNRINNFIRRELLKLKNNKNLNENNFVDFSENIKSVINKEIQNLNKNLKTVGFRSLNESLTNNIDFVSNIVNARSDVLFKDISIISAVDSVVKRFPELEYLIDLISTSAVYSFKQVDKKYGIEINLIIRNNKDDIMQPKEFQNIKYEIYDLLSDNNFYQEGKETLNNVIKYGFSLAYFSKDFNSVEFLSPKDVRIETNNKNDKNIKELSLNNLEFYSLDGRKLDKKRLYFFSQKGIFGKGIRDIIPYFEIIELLETSLLIERLAKSKTLFVWLVDIENLEEEEISSFTSLYRSILQNKVNFDVIDNNNLKYNIGKSFLDNHAILPVVGRDMVRIEPLRLEYKPILEDINYFWEKVYYSMGIPLYYRNMDLKNIPRVALQMHDRAFAMRIYIYQTILNKFLTYWIENWLTINKNYKIQYCNVSLVPFIPADEKRETDLDKSRKLIDILSQAQDFLGITFNKQWVLKMMFPDQYIEEMLVEEENNNEEQNLIPGNNENISNEQDILSDIFSNTENNNNKTEVVTTEENNTEEENNNINLNESTSIKEKIKEINKERLKYIIKNKDVKIKYYDDKYIDFQIDIKI